MRGFMMMLGLPDLAMTQYMVIIGLVAASAFAMAWIADAILGDGAFGVFFNTLILLAGVVLGTLLWRKLGLSLGLGTFATAATVAIASALGMLVACSVARRWV